MWIDATNNAQSDENLMTSANKIPTHLLYWLLFMSSALRSRSSSSGHCMRPEGCEGKEKCSSHCSEECWLSVNERSRQQNARKVLENSIAQSRPFQGAGKDWMHLFMFLSVWQIFADNRQFNEFSENRGWARSNGDNIVSHCKHKIASKRV